MGAALQGQMSGDLHCPSPFLAARTGQAAVPYLIRGLHVSACRGPGEPGQEERPLLLSTTALSPSLPRAPEAGLQPPASPCFGPRFSTICDRALPFPGSILHL